MPMPIYNAGEDLIRAFQAGLSERHAAEALARQAEDRQIEKELLKDRLARMRTEEKFQQWQRQRQATIQNVDLMSGQPEAQVPAAQLEGLSARDLSQVTAGYPGQQSEAMPVAANQPLPMAPVTVPGFADLGIADVAVRPQTLEQILAGRIADARLKASQESYTLNAGDRRFRGDQQIAEGAPREEPTVTIRTMENGREVTKVLPRSQAVGQSFPAPPRATASTGAAGTQDIAKEVAGAIIAGDQPPDLKGLYRYGASVRAELARNKYDLTKAQLDWQATSKHLATLNGPQQLRLRQAATTAYESLDLIEKLADAWKGGRFQVLNRARLGAAKQGNIGGSWTGTLPIGSNGEDVTKDWSAQEIATMLDAQITDVTSELGNVYMGGNSPTDHALSLAGKNLGSQWSEQTLRSAVALARTNLRYRLNSIQSAGVAGRGEGFQMPGGATATPDDVAGGGSSGMATGAGPAPSGSDWVAADPYAASSGRGQTGAPGRGGGPASAQALPPVPAGMVRMKAPNGQVSVVPDDQVEHYKALGAVIVQ